MVWDCRSPARFAHQATVGIVARNRDKLIDAAKSLDDCRHWPCDVTSDEAVTSLFKQVAADWQQIDVLINAVGKSDRKRVLSCAIDDFQALWETNFLATVRCIRAAMPIIEPKRGSIVNIASLAAKIATANMGAYPVSKFAVAAYTQQLQRELQKDNSKIHVMLVCPGPIQRADAGHRYAAAENVPQSALQPAGGARLRNLDPTRLAEMIVRGCERRQSELILPRRVRLLLAISALSPSLGDWIVARMTS